MHIVLTGDGIEIRPESAQDAAYLTDTMGLRKVGSTLQFTLADDRPTYFDHKNTGSLYLEASAPERTPTTS